MATRPPKVPDDWVLVQCENPKCDQKVWAPEIHGVLKVCSAKCARELTEHLQVVAHTTPSADHLRLVQEFRQQRPYDREQLRMCRDCLRMLDEEEVLDGIIYVHSAQDVRAMTRAGQLHHPVPVPVDMRVLLARCDFCNVDLVKTEQWTVPAEDFFWGAENHWVGGDWAACPICVQLIADNRWGKLITRVLETYAKNHGGGTTPPREILEIQYGRLRVAMKGPPYLEEVTDG